MQIILFNLLFFLLLSGKSLSNTPIELQPVYIPVEIVNVKVEKRETITPPPQLQPFSFKLQLDIKSKVSILIGGIDDLPFLSIEKPKSYLGIPLSNALLSRGMDNFNNGNLIFAKSDLLEFVNKYKDSPYLYYAYYLLGYIEFKNYNLSASSEHLQKSCTLNPTKEVCLSLAIVNLLSKNFDGSKKALNYIDDKDLDRRFMEESIYILEKRDFGKSISVDCGKVDLSISGYCSYLKKYTYFFRGEYERVIKTQLTAKTPALQRQGFVLDGFSNHYLGRISQAYKTFDYYLEKVSLSDRLSNLALYGKALSDNSLLTPITQVLQSRDEELSQDLYLRKGEELLKSGDYLNGFLHLQTALYLYHSYKEDILLNIAVSMYNMKNYSYAMGILKEMPSKRKEPAVQLYAGYTAYMMREFSEAEKFFSRLTDQRGFEEVSLEYLSDIYLQTRDDENFVDTALKLRQINPEKAYNLLGWYFFQKGDYEKAFKSFRDRYMKAVSAYNINDLKSAKELIQDSTNEKSTLLKAYIHLKENDLEKARSVLKTLKEREGKYSEEAFYLYAYSYFSEGKFDIAVLHFKDFLRLYGGKDDEMVKKAFLRVADSYYNLGEFDIARSLYSDFISRYSNTQDAINASYNLLLLESKEGSGDIKTSLEKFIRNYPDYPMVPLLKLQLAQIYTQQNNYLEAERIYTEVVAKNTKESEMALYQLANMFLKKGDLEKAKESCLSFIGKYPNSDNLFNVKMLLAQIYQMQGDIDNALHTYYQIQDNDQVKFTIAQLLLNKGDFNRSLEYLRELYSKYPDKRNLSLYIGKAYVGLGKGEEAERYFQEATKSDNPKVAGESYYNLGLIYKDKDMNKALNYFLNSIYINPEVDIINVNARFEASSILLRAEKRKEASCLLREVLKYKDDEIKQKAEKILKDLPKCVY
ncbi:MAG: tetratricopeptide repeat protein [Hydrogenothermaceae bacterium]|nr:tetratricopeptide repeat protein [Hydrogenothermaceae bacterium]